MLQSLHNFFALAGIALVLCALLFRAMVGAKASGPWVKWVILVFFAVLWVPVGQAQIPLLAYVRGISSDLSITLVLLACAGPFRRLLPGLAPVEQISLLTVILLAALLLYPMALGWGNWDPYRLGWGNIGMWGTLLVLTAVCWVSGLRWLPVLMASALLCWSVGLLESGNLWDYLLDPWLVLAACVYGIRLARAALLARLSRDRQLGAGSAVR